MQTRIAIITAANRSHSSSGIFHGNTVDLGAYEYQNRPAAAAGTDTSICIGTSIQIGKPANPNHIYSWTSSPAGFFSSQATPTISPSATTSYFLEATNEDEPIIAKATGANRMAT